tara:strand:+ start:14771 stop:15181 length:411 start_codon:yes stop_codon:yes gene_type:complete
MATKNSATFRNTVPNGTFGTISKAEGTATFDGDAIDTTINVMKLEAGTKIFGIKAFNDALGASTTVKIGYAFLDAGDGTDDDDGFVAATATVTAGTLSYTGKPITFDVPVIVTVTNEGGVATGDVVVIPEYEFRGV